MLHEVNHRAKNSILAWSLLGLQMRATKNKETRLELASAQPRPEARSASTWSARSPRRSGEAEIDGSNGTRIEIPSIVIKTCI